MGLRTPVEFRWDPVDEVGAPSENPGDPAMRFSDVFYPVALVILLGWLVLSSGIDAEYPGSSLNHENTTPSLPAVSAVSLQPQPVARATVDERNFWIFVAGSPDVWSVAVSDDD